ncbi:MAG: ergothioneine biosynthesis protein EgtB [Thermoleophilaceae bacterium]
MRSLLDETRRRTHWLVESVTVEDLERVHNRVLSPLVWDLAHIALFEDLWLCRNAGGLELLRPDLMQTYDASETPRSRRSEIPLLGHHEVIELMEAVRERALVVLDAADLADDEGGFLWDLVVSHEQQHNETMLQTLKIARPGVLSPTPRELPSPRLDPPLEMVRLEGGPFELGAADTGFSYDNERPRHRIELAPFEIDRVSVTNGDYLEFIEAGGYSREQWWSERGWAWRAASGVVRPLYWTADGRERHFDRLESIDPRLPVMHVSWYEADAFARSRGKRLPTESEWEYSAAWTPDRVVPRRLPWGDEPPSPRLANLDQTSFRQAPVGAHPAGASATGVLGMIGDAWEWTASEFTGYPGFSAHPYEEYSAVFFGSGHRVLRGGSWATRTGLARNSNRNWDLPQRRQIFAGFRCARDA